MSTPIKGHSFAIKPASGSSSSGDTYNNSSLPLFMLSHIHNQKSTGGVANRIYPENSPERKTHDSLLRSPNGSNKVRAVNGSSSRKAKRSEN